MYSSYEVTDNYLDHMEQMSIRIFITLYLFLNWGTPSLNSFDNEMDDFSILMEFDTQLHSLTNRPESRVYEITRVSVMVIEGITTWYQIFG